MDKVKPCRLVSTLVVVISQLAAAKAHDLTVQVEPHKTVFALGEPVVITATVVNRGAEAVTLIHHNAPTLYNKISTVDVLLGVDEEHLKRWDDRMRIDRATNPESLPAGNTITLDLVVLFNSKHGFFATDPGKYWIQGRIVIAPSPYIEILSSPVQIEVRAPSRSDRAVWQWLNDHKDEYGRLVQVPWEATLSDEFVQECDRICTKTSSVYSEYLAYSLSRWYHEGPKKDAQQSVRFAEIAKAKASSEKVRTEADKLLTKNNPNPSP